MVKYQMGFMTHKKTKLLILLSIFFTFTLLKFAVGYNEVLDGSVYRYRQLSSDTLEDKIKELGIRTIINLRGKNLEEEWYLEERSVAEAHKVQLFDVGLNSKKLPNRAVLQRLTKIIRTAERPILMHCEGGNERTGMASAVALLLEQDKNLHDAREQVSLKYFNFTEESVGRQFLSRYEKWLSNKNVFHTSEEFLNWMDTEYVDDYGNFIFVIDEINGLAYKDDFQLTMPSKPVNEIKTSGWAIDPINKSPVKKIDLLLNDKPIGTANYGLQRNGVAAFFEDKGYTYSGWRSNYQLTNWPRGCYDLRLRIERNDSEHWLSGPKAHICLE